MIRQGSLGWFAQHEARLAWRDFLSLMTAGHRWRERSMLIGFAVFAVILHLIAYMLTASYADALRHPDKGVLVVVTGTALLSWSVMLAQAMEAATRGLYARADLDLILSSPAAARLCFAVRVAAMPISIMVMTLAFAAPFINALVWRGGPRWLGAYGMVAAMAMTAVAVAVLLTMLLFRLLGPRQTRLVSQVVSAVIGAGFVIFLQIAAIISYGNLSRTAFLQSRTVIDHTPALGSVMWFPARAILGDPMALAIVLAASLLVLGGAILLFAARFGGYALLTAGQSARTAQRQQKSATFRALSSATVLRRKEWTLLARDPWLLSQCLMQLLYLTPPAVLLWRNFGTGTGIGAVLLLVPVLTMAAGQLGGGLAWLAVSGEDAPDLIATAPLRPNSVLRAKIEAVLGGIALVMGPFLIALAFVSPFAASIGVVSIAAAAASSTAIQLWFRSQAKRSAFRRRQTSSRIATFAEALSSVGWAATGGIAAQNSWLASIPLLITILILAATRALSPAKI